MPFQTPILAMNLTFPVKLFQILEFIDLQAPHLKSIMSWSDHGRCFRILDKTAFEKTIMPIFFKSVHYDSIRRQLNIWGFKRVNEVSGGYYHEKFLRGQETLSHLIERNTSQSGSCKTSEVLDFDSLPPMQKSLLERQKKEISDLTRRTKAMIKAMETEKKNAIDKLQSELSKQKNDNTSLKAQLDNLGKEKHDLDSQLCEMKLIKEVSASLHTEQRKQDDNINSTEERTPKRSRTRRTLFPSEVSPESQQLLDLKKKNEELLRIIENQAADHHSAMKQIREAYEKPYMDF